MWVILLLSLQVLLPECADAESVFYLERLEVLGVLKVMSIKYGLVLNCVHFRAFIFNHLSRVGPMQMLIVFLLCFFVYFLA